MRRIKYVTVVAIVAISGMIGFMSMENNSTKTELSGLALANVEALTQGEGSGGLDCSYLRNESRCKFFVGAKGSIKLVGGAIIKAGRYY